MNDLTRQELDAKIAASEAKVDARLANFDTSIKSGFAQLRAEFADLRTDMAKMQGEMHKSSADTVKWVIGMTITGIGVTVGLLTYINKASDRPGQSVQPVIYYVQPSTAPTTPAAPK